MACFSGKGHGKNIFENIIYTPSTKIAFRPRKHILENKKKIDTGSKVKNKIKNKFKSRSKRYWQDTLGINPEDIIFFRPNQKS